MTNFQFNDAATAHTLASHTHTHTHARAHITILYFICCVWQTMQTIHSSNIHSLSHVTINQNNTACRPHRDARTKMVSYRMYHHRNEKHAQIGSANCIALCVGLVLLVLLLVMLPHEIHLYVIIPAKHPHPLSISVYLANEFINISVYSE